MSDEHVQLSEEGLRRKDAILRLAMDAARTRRRRRTLVRAAVAAVMIVAVATMAAVLHHQAQRPQGPAMASKHGVAPVIDGRQAPALPVNPAPVADMAASSSGVGSPGRTPVAGVTKVEHLDDRQLVQSLSNAGLAVCLIRVRGRTEVFVGQPGGLSMERAGH
jgi:hypothetical protein